MAPPGSSSHGTPRSGRACSHDRHARHRRPSRDRRRMRRSGPGRLRPLAALAAALMLIASACGSDDPGPPVVDAEASAGGAQPLDAAGARVRDGMAAAGGRLDAHESDLSCADVAPADRTAVAYLGPDLDGFDDIGLEELVIEDPRIVLEAYVDALNAAGGIDGRCFRVSAHMWDPADPEGSYGPACSALTAARPLFTLNFLGDVAGIECAAVQAGIPTVGLYASAPSDVVEAAAGGFFLDDGTHEYLLENSIEVALRGQYLARDAKIGFLRGSGSGADDQIAAQLALMRSGLLDLFDMYGIDVGSVASVTGAFSEYATLLPEQQARLLMGGMTAAEQEAAQQARAAMAGPTADLLDRIETFYVDATAAYRDAGVEVIVSTAPWFELRRLMRAAEAADWHPLWIVSDIQSATLTLTGAPAVQAERFLAVSARRAAGDEVPPLDRACVLVRNTSTEAPAFAHRHHTDAWSVVTAACDVLDVAFAAVSRADGDLTRESFAAAMRQTDYDAPHGGRTTYSAGDSSGADRFRVLAADPDCVLNEWGCMRALTDWLAPTAEAGDAAR